MRTNNKPIILIGIAILLLSVLSVCIGGTLAGWNIFAWFRENTAWAIFLLVIFVFIVLSILIKAWVNER